MTPSELHNYPRILMGKFYSPVRLIWFVLRTLLFPVDYLTRGWTIGLQRGWLTHWKKWHKEWFGKWSREWKKDFIKVIGHTLLVRWQKRYKESGAFEKIEKYCQEKNNS